MPGKITLITPPDIFENTNPSILFMHLTEEEQDAVTKWLSEHVLKDDVNFYVYSDENNLGWIFYALSRCEYKYINTDCYNSITQALGGYILGKNNAYYKTSDANIAAIYSHINHNKVDNVIKFLETIFSEQATTN
jgi:hypothetical protein